MNKNQLSDSSVIYTLRKKLTSNQTLQEITHLKLYKENNNPFYIPELEILELGLKLLNQPYQTYQLNKHDLFIDELPILQINHFYFNQHQFIDIIINLFLDDHTNIHNQNNIIIIEQFRQLNKSQLYFSLVQPQHKSSLQDRYWLFINPVLKFKQYINNLQIKQSLHKEGISTRNKALSNARQIFTFLQQMLNYGHLQQGQLSFNIPNPLKIVDIVGLCYFKAIVLNCKQSQLFELFEEFTQLQQFYLAIQTEVTDNQFDQYNRVKNIFLVDDKKKKEQPQQINQKQAKNKLKNKKFIILSMLSAFMFIYKKYGKNN